MGGKAVKGVVRINQENVAATLDDIYHTLLPLIGIDKKNTTTLGSAGKKLPGGSSGDIDLALDSTKLTKQYGKEELLQFLANCAEALGYDAAINKGFNQVSIQYPIVNADGKQEGQLVQLDLMPSDNLEFVKWGSYSPAEKDSPYKGAVRQNLLGDIAFYYKYKVLERDEQGNPITRQRGAFAPTLGMYLLKQTRKSPKTGNIVKRWVTIDRKLVSQKPDEIAQLLLGHGVKARDIKSVNDVWRCIQSDYFPYPEHRKDIIKSTVENDRLKGFSYPEEWDAYIQ